MRPTGEDVTEALSRTPEESVSVGYAQSKWVAEQVCHAASKFGLPVSILRLGQLCGDTKLGIWNESEGWPLMIKTAETLHCLPNLDEVCRLRARLLWC